MAGRTLIIPIYYLILIACIGVSSNFSFRGFYETFPTEIYIVVMILALGLFGAGLMLQIGRDRKSITQQLLALMIFVIFAAFSTSSNVNYIYTKMKWEDVRKEAFREEYQKYLQTLDIINSDLIDQITADGDYFEKIATGYYDLINQDISDLKSAILTSGLYQNNRKMHNDLTYELEQLLRQATDPALPGCGPKCKEHLSNINQIVPTTEKKLPSSKKISDLQNWWLSLQNDKMSVFCGNDAFADYHYVRSLSQRVPKTDLCRRVDKSYADRYPPNFLEKLRAEIQREENYDEAAALDYIKTVSEVHADLQQIASKLAAIDEDLAFEKFQTTDGYPRTISEAVEFLGSTNSKLLELDISGIKQREKLSRDLKDQQFLTATVSSFRMDEDETYVLDQELSQNDVVNSVDIPLRPFLEVLSAKREEIVTRFSEATGEMLVEELNELKIDESNGQIGEVQYTLKLAFNNFSQTTVIAILLGAAFDLIPIIFAFAAFHGYKPDEPEYDPTIG